MGGLGKDLASKPRIVFVCHTAQLGGAELSLIDVILGFEQLKTVILLEDGPLYRRLSAEGVDVRIYNTGTKLKKVKRNSRLSSLLISIPSVLASARFVARSCDSGCIIYANSQKAMIVAAVANILRRTPVVWHLRDILSPIISTD